MKAPIFLPGTCHIAQTHAHLGERLCGHTKQAVRCHSPTARCTFIPNDITQVWVREGGLGCSFSLQPLKEQGIFEARWRVSKNIVADICVEATSLILKKKLQDYILCFCEIAELLADCFSSCYNQLSALKLSCEDKCASRSRVLEVAAFWPSWKASAVGWELKRSQILYG